LRQADSDGIVDNPEPAVLLLGWRTMRLLKPLEND
jgi:hypothetical protein